MKHRRARKRNLFLKQTAFPKQTVFLRQTVFLLATSCGLTFFALCAEAQSHRGARAGAGGRVAAGGHRAQAISRPAPRRQARAPVQRRRSPSPGFGSAANVRPGFYRQLDAPRSRHRPRHGTAVAPVYVYLEPVYTEPFYPEAQGVDPRQIPAPAPAPAPQPIYIVAPPAAAAAPPPAPEPALPPPPPPAPRSTEPGEVRFSIQPADAEVYLDDDYLGTGAQLAALVEAELYAPGVHVLEVTHPDYRPQRLVFGVSGKDPAHVLIDLSIDRVGRRSRIK